jgi:hypothetical protein
MNGVREKQTEKAVHYEQNKDNVQTTACARKHLTSARTGQDGGHHFQKEHEHSKQHSHGKA